jgi:hypothetical protein
MGSLNDAWLNRRVLVRGLRRTGVVETGDPPLKMRPFEDLSGFENSLLVGDSSATERRFKVDEDWRLRTRGSGRPAIVLSKAAEAIASKPEDLCGQGELGSRSQLGAERARPSRAVMCTLDENDNKKEE